jgi:hypothetical protein
VIELAHVTDDLRSRSRPPAHPPSLRFHVISPAHQNGLPRIPFLSLVFPRYQH